MSSVIIPPPALALPNIVDYATFLAKTVGVPQSYLLTIGNIVLDSSGNFVLDSSQAQVTSNPTLDQYTISLIISQEIVNDQLALASQDVYTLAVYNLGADRLVNYGADLPGGTFFNGQRTLYRLNSLPAGIISSTTDQGTGSSFLNPDFMKGLTFQDLQNMRTPWGRQYLAFAQMYGSAIWGLT